jgi:hypothetical protein
MKWYDNSISNFLDVYKSTKCYGIIHKMCSKNVWEEIAKKKLLLLLLCSTAEKQNSLLVQKKRKKELRTKNEKGEHMTVFSTPIINHSVH